MCFFLWRLPWLLVAGLSLVMLTIPWLPVFLTLTPIDAVTSVRQLMQEEQYAAAAEQVDYFLEISTDESERHKLQQLAEEIEVQRSDWSYQADKIVTEGLLTGFSDEWTGQLAGVTSAFLVLGDVRDLANQGLHWLSDEPVDDALVVLSSLGLLATTAQWVSLGTSTPLKSSVTLLTLAHKAGSLPAWLITALKGGISRAWEIRSLSPLRVNLSRVTELTERVGLGPGLALLGQTRGPGPRRPAVRPPRPARRRCRGQRRCAAGAGQPDGARVRTAPGVPPEGPPLPWRSPRLRPWQRRSAARRGRTAAP